MSVGTEGSRIDAASDQDAGCLEERGASALDQHLAGLGLGAEAVRPRGGADDDAHHGHDATSSGSRFSSAQPMASSR